METLCSSTLFGGSVSSRSKERSQTMCPSLAPSVLTTASPRGREKARAPLPDGFLATWLITLTTLVTPTTSENETTRSHSRPPLQGGSVLGAYPGLKPWAILLCHFMATACAPRSRHRTELRSSSTRTRMFSE